MLAAVTWNVELDGALYLPRLIAEVVQHRIDGQQQLGGPQLCGWLSDGGRLEQVYAMSSQCALIRQQQQLGRR